MAGCSGTPRNPRRRALPALLDTRPTHSVDADVTVAIVQEKRARWWTVADAHVSHAVFAVRREVCQAGVLAIVYEGTIDARGGSWTLS